METENSQRFTIKLIYLLKRFMDDWNEKKLCRVHYPGFNHAHLPVFMSIGQNGISNNELAEKLNVTKQATSKIIKELEEINMVRSEKSAADARSVILHYTPDGEKYYHYIKTQIYQLEDQYKKLVGAKNYEIAIDVLLKLVEFHEKQSCLPA
ncbi:MarR family winged helix-turn-helix transcriptional regulator [Mucilaginibacter gotjawali]|uniref:MarR family protein n=2 Tax=Mucilaginibacter gotjawali TaxID=1550579 RepID=A0A0X8X259_9SPHI|nr:MarR family winged helix-turn-helix transcriptional regulator [Mucilaginibacter gotjawali]MBB3053980.1 DNA-binding MarR family transcriptional regulator [Mucilaginibacter gotjawali]BAU54245.1 MarR family protein [Mucilaginibacter gotjawali]